MEDYIMKEVSKIGEAISAMLAKFRLHADNVDAVQLRGQVSAELSELLGADIDSLISRDDFVTTLVSAHHFSNDDLNRLAELLYAMLRADDGKDEVHHSYAKAIVLINKWLDGNDVAYSASRNYVLEVMNSYF